MNHMLRFPLCIATLAIAVMLPGRGVADFVVIGERNTVVTSAAVQEVPIEFYLDLTGTDAPSTTIGDFSVKIHLVGPNAGTDVALVSASNTTSAAHPQAAPLAITSITPASPHGTTAFGFTFNLIPVVVDDLDGLMQVVLRVQPNVQGLYQLQIVSGGPVPEVETSITDPAGNQLPFTSINGSLHVIPEPSAFLLVLLVGLGVWTCRHIAHASHS